MVRMHLVVCTVMTCDAYYFLADSSALECDSPSVWNYLATLGARAAMSGDVKLRQASHHVILRWRMMMTWGHGGQCCQYMSSIPSWGRCQMPKQPTIYLTSLIALVA
jgi:hypothetical protein